MIALFDLISEFEATEGESLSLKCRLKEWTLIKGAGVGPIQKSELQFLMQFVEPSLMAKHVCVKVYF